MSKNNKPGLKPLPKEEIANILGNYVNKGILLSMK